MVVTGRPSRALSLMRFGQDLGAGVAPAALAQEGVPDLALLVGARTAAFVAPGEQLLVGAAGQYARALSSS